MRNAGNYYANGTEFRNGKRYGKEVARQAKSFAAARKALDESGLSGYVQLWSDRTQQRTVIADRDINGQWTSVDPFTGERVPLA